MATLNANALTNLNRTKAELDIPLANTDFDDQVIQYINAISDVIEADTNRNFTTQNYVHRFSGTGINLLVSKQFPITAINNVWVSQSYDFSVAEAVTTYTFLDDVF